MQFLVDENMALSYAKTLRSLGYVAVHVAEVDLTSTEDTDIVAYAIVNGYSIITFDLDFTRIVALSQKSFPSIITFRLGEINVFEFEEYMNLYIPDLINKIIEGSLITIDSQGVRVKKLPVKKK